MSEVKTVLVTGSSRGIGKAIAKRLQQDGWRIILHASRPESLNDSLRRETSAMGEIIADLSDPAQALQLMRQLPAFGPIHAVVNNAGVYRPFAYDTPDETLWTESWGETLAVNLISPSIIMREAALLFSRNDPPGGTILNVASRVGFKAEAGAAAYAASKAALISLTRSLAVEWATQGVRLFGLAPGWVETAMSRDGMEERVREIVAGIPLGRMAMPEDCAAVARFLLSEEAAYLSGLVVDINGASYFH
ncbi:MAG: beta-ketoacyl-ACP reductase [Armatimonadota bacterium]